LLGNVFRTGNGPRAPMILSPASAGRIFPR
jgi:hypothetical protein